jgi:hypothetical protein
MTEVAMCYARKSSMSEDRKTVETDQSKGRRSEVVDSLLRDANKDKRTTSPAEAPVKESVPTK